MVFIYLKQLKYRARLRISASPETLKSEIIQHYIVPI